MKKIIFFSTPAYGHVFSVLPVIKALTDYGHQVICYGTPQFRPYLEKCNVLFEEYSIPLADIALSAATADFYALLEHLTRLNQDAFFAYDEFIRQTDADLILYDSMCSFAKNLAGRHKKTSVCLVTTLAYNLPVFLCSNLFFSSIPLYFKNMSGFFNIIKKENAFRRKYRLPKLDLMDLFINFGDETLVFTPKEFQPFPKTFSKNVHFVGTTIKERISLLHEEQEYSSYDYYVSMGSIFTQNLSKHLSLFKHSFFAKQKILAVTGSKPPSAKQGNLTMVPTCSQIDILPRCRAFINHGGLNSVYESIYFGIPQLCIPQQEEQYLTAQIAKRKNAACYAKSLNEKSIYKFEKRKSSLSMQKWQDIFKRYDGTARSLEIINALLENQTIIT